MDLQTALSQIKGPVGFSSLVAGLMGNDPHGLNRQSPVGATLAEAEAKLEAVRKAQNECKSDYAYWGYEGEVAAWEAAVDVIRAAEIVGPDNLADIPYSPGGGVVMDECAKLSRWGTAILAAAKRTQKQDANI